MGIIDFQQAQDQVFMKKDQLTGKTALVTGAAKRIGREIALSLGNSGVNVVIHYRSSAGKAEKLKQIIEDSGVNAWVTQATFSKETDYSKLISNVKEVAGNIDFLVNNASIFPKADLKGLGVDDLEKNIQINSWAPFALTRSFFNQFDSGKVVNLLDTRIAGYDWNHVGYYFSKVLLARMTKMMAIRFAPDFFINGVAPGLVIPPEGLTESYLEERVDRVPLSKYGDESDVAESVIFLLGANFITGQIIYVDGGRNLLHEFEG